MTEGHQVNEVDPAEEWWSKEQSIEAFLDSEGVTVEHPSNAKYALFGPIMSRRFYPKRVRQVKGSDDHNNKTIRNSNRTN